MKRCFSNAEEPKTWRRQRTLTNLLTGFVLVSTIAGSIYVGHGGKLSDDPLGGYLKKYIKFPAWTSSSLLVNIILGYVAVFKRNRIILSIKLGFDAFQLANRFAIILFMGIFLLPVYRHVSEPNRGQENLMRLDFWMLLIVFLTEILMFGDLLASCIFYCQCCGEGSEDDEHVFDHNNLIHVEKNEEKKELV